LLLLLLPSKSAVHDHWCMCKLLLTACQHIGPHIRTTVAGKQLLLCLLSLLLLLLLPLV
jgi:hypothetical protein